MNKAGTPASAGGTVGGIGASPAMQGSIHIPANGKQVTDVAGYETVLVDGELEGNVKDVIWLSVAAGGTFSGKAEVDYADLSGQVSGELHCRHKMIIRSTAHVTGTLKASVVEMHPGAVIDGSVTSYGRGESSLLS